MDYLNKIFKTFQNLDSKARWQVLSALLFLLVSIGFLSWFFLVPHYGVLFDRLDPNDSYRIVHQLEKNQTPYRLENQGSKILVPKEGLEKQRIQVLSSGIELAKQVGFELFDKNDFALTDFSQKINYQRALQGELERTIASLDEVSQVRVHLVLPEQHWFQENTKKPSAAVALFLKKALSKQQIFSIQQLIHASVSQLEMQNIVLIDQHGNALTEEEHNASYQHFAQKQAMEGYLKTKVKNLLQPIFKEQRIEVSIDVSLNYDQREEEWIKPEASGQITHEKESEHRQMPKGGKSNENITREKTYQLGSKKEKFIQAPGKIERLSISVALPQEASSKQLLQVEKLVKSVVGFNAGRGDSFSLEAIIQKPQIISPMPLPEKKSINMFWVVVLLVFFMLIFIVFRIKQKQSRKILLIELEKWLVEHAQ